MYYWDYLPLTLHYWMQLSLIILPLAPLCSCCMQLISLSALFYDFTVINRGSCWSALKYWRVINKLPHSMCRTVSSLAQHTFCSTETLLGETEQGIVVLEEGRGAEEADWEGSGMCAHVERTAVAWAHLSLINKSLPSSCTHSNPHTHEHTDSRTHTHIHTKSIIFRRYRDIDQQQQRLRRCSIKSQPKLKPKPPTLRWRRCSAQL